MMIIASISQLASDLFVVLASGWMIEFALAFVLAFALHPILAYLRMLVRTVR